MKFVLAPVEIEKNQTGFDILGVDFCRLDKVVFRRIELSFSGKYTGKAHVCARLIWIDLNNFAEHPLGFLGFFIQIINSCVQKESVDIVGITGENFIQDFPGLVGLFAEQIERCHFQLGIGVILIQLNNTGVGSKGCLGIP